MAKHSFGKIKVHPVAHWLPMLSDEQLQDLADDIARRGQLEPCVFYKGELIDGRNRWLACGLAGVKPRRRTATKAEVGGSVAGFVMSANVRRRDMTASQKSMAAARLQKQYQIDIGGTADHDTRDAAADAMGVSRRSVGNAATVMKYGSKKLQKTCDDGEIAVAKAAKLAQLCRDKSMQDKLLSQGSNAIKSWIQREERKAKTTQQADAPVEYVDDKRRKVPEELYKVWHEKTPMMQVQKVLKKQATELRRINKALQLQDIDVIIESLAQMPTQLQQLLPSLVDEEHGWLTKSEAK